MRLVNYKVMNANGNEFHTTNYKEATESGNRIVRTYFTEIDERTEKEKARARKHVQRVQRILEAKKGV